MAGDIQHKARVVGGKCTDNTMRNESITKSEASPVSETFCGVDGG